MPAKSRNSTNSFKNHVAIVAGQQIEVFSLEAAYVAARCCGVNVKITDDVVIGGTNFNKNEAQRRNRLTGLVITFAERVQKTQKHYNKLSKKATKLDAKKHAERADIYKQTFPKHCTKSRCPQPDNNESNPITMI